MDKQKRITRITTLWIIILTGLIYHTVLHLVPAFYGITVEKAGATGVMPLSMVLTFGLSFFIPVLAIVVLNYMRNFGGWLINFILTLFTLLVNTGHLSEFFMATHFDPTQLFVIIPLFLITVLLVNDSWKLKKDRN
jgi:hypothetical protein